MVKIDKAIRLSPYVLAVWGIHTGLIAGFVPQRVDKDILEVQVLTRVDPGKRLQRIRPQIVLDESMTETKIARVHFTGEGIEATVPVSRF